MVSLGALPALQLDTNLLASAAPIDSFRRGVSDQDTQNQQNLLKQVGSDAATGNYLRAAQTAMRGGDLDTGLALTKHKSSLDANDTEKRLKLLDFFGRGAEGADTPEKWDALLNMAQGVYGPGTDLSQYRDFNTRDQVRAFLSDSKSTLERERAKLELEKTREELGGLREGRQFKQRLLMDLGLTPGASAAPPTPPPSASGVPSPDVSVASPSMNGPAASAPPSGTSAEPSGSRSTQDIIAKMTPAQRTSLGLLLAKEDYAGAARLIQAASGEAERTPPAGYRWSQTNPGELEAIAGGPASKLPSDVAGKVGMMNVAMGNMPKIRDIFLGKEGEADPKTGKPTRKGSNVGMIDYYATAGEIGEGIRLTTGAIESVLRAASGAAVPEQEVTRYQGLFLPSPYDTEITKARKLDALENWIGTMLATIQLGRPVALDAAHRLAQERANAAAATPGSGGPQPGAVEDGHRFKGGNPADPNNWEPL